MHEAVEDGRLASGFDEMADLLSDEKKLDEEIERQKKSLSPEEQKLAF